MKKLSFINGSPRGNNSASQYFIDELLKIIDNNNFQINQIKLNDTVNYEDAAASDILIFAFPLYVDSLPSPVIEFLVNLELYAKNGKKSTKVYAVVNSGFFEGIQNRHAIKIINNFCDKVGYNWRFGVGVGAGEFMRGTKENIPIKSKVKLATYKGLLEINNDIMSNAEVVKNDIFVSPKFPRLLYFLAGNRGWVKDAKSRSISKKQLYSRLFIESK